MICSKDKLSEFPGKHHSVVVGMDQIQLERISRLRVHNIVKDFNRTNLYEMGSLSV